ncbi:beta-lactamase family protein [Kitasatospora sp. RG8]|uniref:serine hydrolase domain-containing protein n=1 Tax=Kitasatospora sp. RG8 TaxID=2820815 RepID=UPI001ADF32B9|nr:serine hydrolase domain-containing protein [Kitasatospora sp. RG8]MBP0452314.1 beta-lactamase family protein [Kitasatospora sp. RG8]
MTRPLSHRRRTTAYRGLAVAAITVAGLLPVGAIPASAAAPGLVTAHGHDHGRDHRHGHGHHRGHHGHGHARGDDHRGDRGRYTDAGSDAAADTASDEDCTQEELSPELAAQLDAAVKQVMNQTGVPGVTVGLWLPGKGRYVRSFGVADKKTGAPMSDDLYMRIGSVTKTFTATAVLELVDDGLVGLDDPISRYVSGVPDGDRITVRNLAEMRSGLFPYSSDPGFVTALESNPTKPFTPEELLAYGYKHPNVAAPGTQFQYNNSNYILLGLLVEKVSGVPLAEFIHDRVTKPSGLDDTVFPAGAEFPSPHAHGYTNQTLNGATVDAADWNPSWGWAAGAMISDLEDMKRWAEDLADGTLLSPETQEQRTKYLSTGLPGAGYGLGIFDVQGWVGHNGSLPGYESLVLHMPGTGATLVVLLNTDILHEGIEPSTLFGQAITKIVTPDNVFFIPATK